MEVLFECYGRMTSWTPHADTPHYLHYLGMYESRAPGGDKVGLAVSNNTSPSGRSSEERLIDLVENAQLNGRLPRDSTGCKEVKVDVSRHGLKITDISNDNVIDRVALISIIQSVSYDDGFGNTNVIFLVQKPLSNKMQCYLFQTRSATAANQVCKQLKQVFSSALR